jgi:hypothetical protein
LKNLILFECLSIPNRYTEVKIRLKRGIKKKNKERFYLLRFVNVTYIYKFVR